MPYGNINVDTVTTSTTGGILGAGNASIMKNRLINGAMVIDQRNAGASITPTNGQYSVDRFMCIQSTASKYSAQQNAGSVTPPVGFVNYLGATSLSAYSVVTGDQFYFNQRIEANNVSDLGWGTANAKTVTLSFWVRSSLTGTFGGSIVNAPTFNYSYPFTYTISSANTWTQISVTIAGPTAGTWASGGTGSGMQVAFGLGVGATFSGTAGSWSGNLYYSATGATSVVGTNGATFYITGVQLEVGSSATGFEYRQYGQELALCQRYYEVGSTYCGAGGTGVYASAPFCVTKRATPTVVVTASLAYTGGATGTVSAGVLSSTMFVMYNPANVHLGATWAATIEL